MLVCLVQAHEAVEFTNGEAKKPIIYYLNHYDLWVVGSDKCVVTNSQRGCPIYAYWLDSGGACSRRATRAPRAKLHGGAARVLWVCRARVALAVRCRASVTAARGRNHRTLAVPNPFTTGRVCH